ncbi:MAG: DEAD/DEAH box helicase family protein [Solirubrobacteraceae bacterium]|nr:DEAD/DEAH box helicase family protein [Solirubrobacteraceae bacterium]
MPGRLHFTGTWRRYQELALEAFDRDVAAGRTRTHIVAPPGSGKTVLGLEIIARLGAPALVLAPTATIQAQWPKALGAFTHPDGAMAVAGTEVGGQITCLTYQALCRLDDPGAGLRDLARTRWADERAAATHTTRDAVLAEAATWTGAAAERRDREQARLVAAIKKAVARGEHPELELADLLAQGARDRIDALRAAGVRTVVLDECHHLCGLWGYLVRAAVAALGDVHLVGLTATPPDELTADEHDLYDELLGPVDFSVPTPAVVKDGFLAPYQELAWFTEPLASERDWLAEHDVRFAELVTALHDDVDSPLSFPQWVLARMRDRGRDDDGAAEIPWERFQRRRPALARAGIRFLASAGMETPPGAPRGEAYARAPDLEDWLVLLEDYALKRLAADPSEAATERYDAIAAALRELGFQLTRRGMRRGTSQVDRLLTSSAAKPLAAVEVLGAESDARGPDLHALVLCDAESAPRRGASDLSGVLDPGAGTAVRVVQAMAEDLRTAPLRALLVSGRGVRCHPQDADTLLRAFEAAADGTIAGWRAEPDDEGLTRLLADAPGWTSRRWVALATRLLHDGATQAIVGTRALLGEGWDAPAVNCLVDLTVATTGVTVRQMRGRSLRLDPERPEKIASNWDVVCVAPGLARGEADYQRFVRRHLHLLAPAEDGAIEAGPSHVHPLLGAFGTPPADAFGEINAACAARAADHDAARDRWRIGEPYAAREVATAVIRRRAATPGRALQPADAPLPPDLRAPVDRKTPAAVAGVVAVAAVAAAVALGPIGLALLAGVPATGVWAATRIRRAARAFPVAAPLDLVAHAIADAYVALGELRPEAAASLDLEPRTSGHVRCAMPAADEDESRRFATALDQVLGIVETPRYLVSRWVADPGRSPVRRMTDGLRGRPAFAVRWHPVPDDLGNHKRRATAFHEAWTRWVGPSTLLFTQGTDEDARAIRAQAAAQEPDHETLIREVWM